MAALVLSLCVFAFLALVGYAILALLAADEEPLFRLLLAPVTGAAATMLLVFTINQLGVPVGRFGFALAVATVLAALGVLWKRGGRGNGGRLRRADLSLFVIALVLALLAAGWPMLRFGFDWVSFSNDDMANYCMGAERLLHFGYYHPPNAAALNGSDYTQFMWFLHVLHRPGSELFLAMIEATTRMSSLRLFMPVVLAFMLCQISAAGAMAWAASRSRLAVWVVWVLMTASALVTLGTLYQLIAQVIGVGIAAGLVSVLLRPIQGVATAGRWRSGALIGLLLAGLLLAYTEILPFVALSYVLYVVVTVRADRAGWRRVLVVLGLAAITVIVLLNRFVPLAALYVLGQASHTAAENPATTMFPYYMLPAGPVYFWGLFPIGRLLPADSTMSTWIVVALVLCLIAALVVFRSLSRGQAPAFVCVVMAAVWAVLFVRHSGFGMYKLAMYFQPFILTALVLGWMSLWRSRAVQVLPLLLIAAANLPSQRFYMRMSLGLDRVFTEVPAASSSHVIREYADLLDAHPGSPLVLDTFNSTLAKFQMIESVGRPAMFPSNNFLPLVNPERLYAPLVGESSAATGLALGRAYERTFPPMSFDLRQPAGSTGPAADGFTLVQTGRSAIQSADTPAHPLMFVACTGRQGVFNRWHDPESVTENFRAARRSTFTDHLTFVASDLGQPYFRSGATYVSIYQLEPDVTYATRTMAAAGRYLLFRVENPSARCRLKLDVTDTFTGDGENRLPPADAIGAARVPFPLVGRGSARVFSGPLSPQIIGGVPFLAIDMGTDGAHVNYEPGGLMKLWGRNVRLDRRRIVGFIRDISLISEDEYQALKGPAVIERFPQDLGSPTLEYSGIYEDGYASGQFFAGLTQPTDVRRLAVEGIIPRIDDPAFKVEAVLSLDGKPLVRRTLGVGEFAIDAEIPSASKHNRHEVAVTFSAVQRLPGGDRRPVGAQLTRLGFVRGPSSVTWQGGDPARHGVRYYGVHADGWADADATVHVVQPAGATHLVIRALVPRIADPNFTTDLLVRVDGKEVARRTVGVGDAEIVADVPASGAGVRAIELSFSRQQQLPAPDGRHVSALLKNVAFEGQSK